MVERIEIPAEAVAAVTFGGPNLDILFVSTDVHPFNTTTGGISTRELSPLSGSIFMVKGLGSRGYPGRKLCIRNGKTNNRNETTNFMLKTFFF